MKTVAIIPFLNEQDRIVEVLMKTSKHVDTVVAVDDGSTDRSEERIAKAKLKNVVVLEHAINCGKGAAVRTGADYAIEELEADVLVFLDGDGQHDPAEVEKFLAAYKKSGASIVFGKRRRGGQMPLLARLANFVLTQMSNILFGMRIYDTQGGYRLLSAEAYKQVRWEANDYAMESEMIVRAGKAGLKYEQVSIKTIYHDKFKGTNVLDGIKVMLRILKWRIRI